MNLHVRALSLILVAIVASSFASALASGLSSIRMTVDDNDQMTITINVNDREGPGVVDTAATYALVDQDMLNDQNSEAREEKVSILGLAGPREFATADIGPVRVGDVNLDIIQAAVNTQTGFPGHKTILPARSFKARVIDFDFRENRIQLYEGRPIRQLDSVVSKFPYREIQGLPFIEIKLNGKKGLALIDTGSDATYVNTAFAEWAGLKPRMDKTVSLIGADTGRTGVTVMSAQRLKIGKHQVRNFLIYSADPALFEILNLDDEPVMVLGLDTLRSFRLQIDREQKQVYLGRSLRKVDGRRYRRQGYTRGFGP